MMTDGTNNNPNPGARNMNTKTLTVTASDGSSLNIVVPTNIPSNDRAEVLRALYNLHVKPCKPGDSWKAACRAIVPTVLAADVADAMDFHGSVVDLRTDYAMDCKVMELRGMTSLYSDGYWAHGF